MNNKIDFFMHVYLTAKRTLILSPAREKINEKFTKIVIHGSSTKSFLINSIERISVYAY